MPVTQRDPLRVLQHGGERWANILGQRMHKFYVRPVVLPTEARARGGVGLGSGCTVKPLLGDELYAMQPQVFPTSGRAHTRAAPGAAPGGDIYMSHPGLTSGLLRRPRQRCAHALHAERPSPRGGTSMGYHPYFGRAKYHNIRHIYCPLLTPLSPPGDGAAPPGDTAGQCATRPPGARGARATRAEPHPPPCPGFRGRHITRGFPGRPLW